jgi:hypothetical protein
VDIATLRLPDGNFGGLYTDSKKDVNPVSWRSLRFAISLLIRSDPRKCAVNLAFNGFSAHAAAAC